MGKTDLITCIKRKTLIKIFIACGISENNKKKTQNQGKKVISEISFLVFFFWKTVFI